MRFVAAFSILSLVCSVASAQSDQDIQADANRIFQKAEDAVSGNLATFLEANEEPINVARQEMAELIARLNKDGRSQLATAMQRRLNTLEESIHKKANAKVPAAARPSMAIRGRVVDLLPQVDIERDALRGQWKRVGDDVECIGTDSDWASLLLQYDPPEEYDFTVEFTRLSGIDGICLYCFANEKRFALEVGTFHNQITGFTAINGLLINKGPASKVGQYWVLGKRHSATAKVRKGEVSGWFDGKEVVTYVTDYGNMSLLKEMVIPTHMLGIGSRSSTRFHKVTVEDMTQGVK